MKSYYEPDELDDIGILSELQRRAALAKWQFTTAEHKLFREMDDDEYSTFYVKEQDWTPNIAGNGPTLATRYRRWQHEMVRIHNDLKCLYGFDYADKVTEIVKQWDVPTAAKILKVREARTAELLEIALSDRWKPVESDHIHTDADNSQPVTNPPTGQS